MLFRDPRSVSQMSKDPFIRSFQMYRYLLIVVLGNAVSVIEVLNIEPVVDYLYRHSELEAQRVNVALFEIQPKF